MQFALNLFGLHFHNSSAEADCAEVNCLAGHCLFIFFTEDENTEANLMFFWLRQTDDELKTVAPAAGEHVKNLSELCAG